jgi:cytochrome bd-type quinol oxidase subunit 2
MTICEKADLYNVLLLIYAVTVITVISGVCSVITLIMFCTTDWIDGTWLIMTAICTIVLALFAIILMLWRNQRVRRQMQSVIISKVPIVHAV